MASGENFSTLNRVDSLALGAFKGGLSRYMVRRLEDETQHCRESHPIISHFYDNTSLFLELHPRFRKLRKIYDSILSPHTENRYLQAVHTIMESTPLSCLRQLYKLDLSKRRWLDFEERGLEVLNKM